MTYKEQVRQLKAELESKRDLIKRQRDELAKYDAIGTEPGFDSIRQSIISAERQVSELENELKRIMPLAAAEPDQEPVNTDKLDQDAQDLIKAMFEIRRKSVKLAAQYNASGISYLPGSLLLLMMARELSALLIRVGSIPGLREIGKRAGVDWQELRK